MSKTLSYDHSNSEPVRDESRAPKPQPATSAEPDKSPLWPAIMAIVSLLFLAFVGGAAIMYFSVFPQDPLRRAFSAGAALYEEMTGYNDRYMTDFWADARTDKRGVTIYDPTRAENGLTLYSSTHEQAAYLMDMEGNVLHRWQMNFSKLWDESAAVKNPRPDELIYIEKAQVLPNGDLIALYTAIGDTPWGYGIAKLNAKSEVIWKYLAHAHHDFAVDDAGNIHVLTQQVNDTELEGFAHLSRPRVDDYLVTLSPDGREIASTPLMEIFAKSPYGRRLYFASQESFNNGDYLHANSVDVLKGPAPGIPGSHAGQVLISFREVSTVALVDRQRGEIVWAQSGPWVRQHDAQLLPSGNMLVFDNEGDSSGNGVSRVLEFEPTTSAVVWSYGGSKDAPLDSKSRSSQTRLANGNTLIVESMAGRVIEVAPDGAIVWEFINPVRGGEGDRRIPIIFWVQRLDPDRDFDEDFKAQISR
ncbi:arylsulfotransferase family protein [Dongia deserti]|uniref:arylsulfotransferase family protein n=1 Tax=Dongia deserti TaxID=2268030 RepID=UPI000E65DD58|nr:arylsulfotransferase family protein [Dongia deserti]